MPDFMNPSADLQAGIAVGWAEGQRQIENMQDEIEHLEASLDEQRARAQRLESTLVLTEDQRDKGIAERDALRNQLDDLQAGMRQWEDEHASAVASVIAERDNLRKQLDNMKADYRDGSYWVIQ